MIKRNKINIYFISNFIFFGLLFLSCSGSDDQEQADPMIDPRFTFHQDLNKLYFAIKVESKYESKNLDSVVVYWYGTSKENSPDIINLNDSGTSGDIISNDNIYGRKISNNSNILNPLNDHTGNVFVDYNAIFGDEIITIEDTFMIGNIIPRIESVSAPDTITRSSDATVSLYLISAQVFDADGIETIKWAGFTSFHIEGDSLMNNGNYIYLYDDGSDEILYEPNITSGDSIRGDGTFSFRIPVYGTGFTDPSFQTRAGTFNWRFLTQDLANEYSQIYEHEIVIQ